MTDLDGVSTVVDPSPGAASLIDHRRVLRAYVATTALVAVAAVGAIFILEEEPPLREPALLVAFAFLVCLDTVLSVSLRRSGEAEALGNEEALFVAMALLVSPLAVLAALASGLAAGQLLLRRPLVKGVFNVAQFAGSAALALLTLALLTSAGTPSVQRTIAVVLAALVFSLANRATVSGWLRVVGLGSFARGFGTDLRLAALVWTGNVAVGLLAGLAGEARRWTLVFVLPAMVVLGGALSGHWRARRNERTLRDLIESSSAAIFSVDRRGRVRTWNPEMEEVTGCVAQESVGRPLADVLSLRDQEEAPVDDLFAPSTLAQPLERRLVRLENTLDGERWLVVSRAPLQDEGFVFVGQEITEQRRAEKALRESEERFRQLFENATDMVCSLDEGGRFTAINRAGETITGYAAAELIGMSFEGLVAPDDLPRERAHFEHALSGAVEAMIEEFAIVRKDGIRAVLDVSYTRVETRGGKRLEVIARDITERKRLEQELRRQAFYDSLTGLANRALFCDRVAHALARRHASVGVLYLDLDDFKAVNDGLGHHAGDRLLVEVANRLRGCARPADTCARIGGDEFALLLEDLPAPDVAVQTAERILASLETPIPLPGAEVSVRTSIGIALPGSDEEGPDELLRNADVAMYRVKTRGKNGHETFERSMLTAAHERLQLSGELRRALAEKSQLTLHYQPLVELQSGTITGVEALARWQHPQGRLIPPAEFIPLAEHAGLIIELSRWTLAEACRQTRLWQTAYPHDQPLTVSVNLSGRHLQSADVVRDIERALAEHGLAPASLILELTESVVAENADAAEKLRKLKALGVRIALDDFGTGYSSLAYLQQLPIDILKIDKTFVLAASQGAKERAFASTIISLGDNLELTVIAEGIEHPQQRDQLYTLGCRLGQGFLFAPPLTPEELEPLLRTRVIETARLRLRIANSRHSAT